MCVEAHRVPSTLHPQPPTFTGMDQEDAYYRAHTLTAPSWLIAAAALVPMVRRALASAALSPQFHRHSNG